MYIRIGIWKKASMLILIHLPKTMQYKYKAATKYNEICYKQTK